MESSYVEEDNGGNSLNVVLLSERTELISIALDVRVGDLPKQRWFWNSVWASLPFVRESHYMARASWPRKGGQPLYQLPCLSIRPVASAQ